MRTTILISLGLAASVASADVVWNEFSDGDLSTDPDAPTSIGFALGGNTIIGSVRSPDDTRDYITFEIPQGMGFAALLQHQWEDLDIGGDGNTGFHAINEGATSSIPSNDTIAFFLGADHMLPEAPGTDLLPKLDAGPFGTPGFDIPLSPGTYSYLVQQTGTQHTGYTLEFVLIPAPSSAALLAVAALASTRRRAPRLEE